MSASDSSDAELNPAPRAPHRDNALYQRQYRRRRQLNAREMQNSSSSEQDMSDDGNFRGRSATSDEISDEMSDVPDVPDVPASPQADNGLQVPQQMEYVPPENEDAVNIEPLVVLNENHLAAPQDEGINSESESDSNVGVQSSGESSEDNLSSPDVSEESEGNSSDDEGDDRLYDSAPVTVGETLLAILTFFMRHKLTGQCLSDLLNLIAVVCPPDNQCVKTLYKFKKYFSMLGQALLVFHYFCSDCEIPLANVNDACEQCGVANKANYFLELPLLTQLQELFLRDNFYEYLQYRFLRRKKFPNNVEDIYDGEVYKREMENGFLRNPNNISFMWYSDGIAII